MKADLHMHSVSSDGRCTMRDLVDRAALRKVDVIAITDHDVVGPIDDAIAYGKTKGVRVLPGIELSTLEQYKSVHLLGYFTDESYHSDEILQYFRDIKARREARAKTIIAKLEYHHGIRISYEDVLDQAGGIIARPHIAQSIHRAYPQYDHDEIFASFLGDHCPAYVPSVELPVQDGIDLLRRHHCMVVLAHPTLLKPHIKESVLAHAFDGIEAHYPQNREGETEGFIQLAASRDMIVTAGSDFHGIEGDTKHGDLGDLTLSGEALDAFFHRFKKVQQTHAKPIAV